MTDLNGSWSTTERERGVARIFINYRNTDETMAVAMLEERLTAHFGPGSVFWASKSMRPAIDFPPQLWGALAHAEAMVVVIGARWLDPDASGNRRIDAPADYVREEIALGLKIGIPVLPVLVGEVGLPPAEVLPEEIRGLATRQYLRLHGRTADRDLPRIVDALAALIDGAARRTPDPATTPTAPLTGEYTTIMVGVGAGADPVPAAARREATALTLRALADLGIATATVITRPQADGVLLLLPPADAAAVGAGFARALQARLVEPRDGDAGPPLRLRVAADHGDATDDGEVAHGAAVETARQMVAGPTLPAVLAAASSVRLVFAASETFFRLAVRGRREIDQSSYHEADFGSDGTGWVHVPGRSAPPGLPKRRPAPAAAPPPDRDRRDDRGRGTTIGTINGDYVAGDKHVSGATYNFGDRAGRE